MLASAGAGGSDADEEGNRGRDSEILLESLEDEMMTLVASFDLDDVNDDDVFHERPRFEEPSPKVISTSSSGNKKKFSLKEKEEEDRVFEKFLTESRESIGRNDFIDLFSKIDLRAVPRKIKKMESQPDLSSAETFDVNNFDHISPNYGMQKSLQNSPTSPVSPTSPQRKISTASIVLRRQSSTSSTNSATTTNNNNNHHHNHQQKKPFNATLALQQIRSKHQGILSQRHVAGKGRSAPTSPTTRKKYSTLPASVSRAGGGDPSTFAHLTSSSTMSRGRPLQRSGGGGGDASSSMMTSSYDNHMRSLSCSNSALSHHHHHQLYNSQQHLPPATINKASSLKSLSLGRRRRGAGGSHLSLISIDSEANEEELKERYDEARKDRIKEQQVAQLEKARLQSIMNMCSELQKMHSRDDEDDGFGVSAAAAAAAVKTPDSSPDKLAPPSSASSPAAQESNHRHLRRLASFEDDVINSSSKESSPAPASGGSLLPSSSSTRKKKVTVARSAVRAGDVGEMGRLREDNLLQLEETQRRIVLKEEQISESAQAVEMEKELMVGELTCERKLLQAELKRCDEIKDAIIQLEEKYMQQREKQQAIVKEEKERLTELEESVSSIKRQIDKCPESLRASMEDQLNEREEALEAENQKFEDAEFQAFEILSKLDEKKEEKQRQLIAEKKTVEANINTRKERVGYLEEQISEVEEQHKLENQRLNMERDEQIARLQEQRKELLLLEEKHFQLAGEYPRQQADDNDDEQQQSPTSVYHQQLAKLQQQRAGSSRTLSSQSADNASLAGKPSPHHSPVQASASVTDKIKDREDSVGGSRKQTVVDGSLTNRMLAASSLISNSPVAAASSVSNLLLTNNNTTTKQPGTSAASPELLCGMGGGGSKEQMRMDEQQARRVKLQQQHQRVAHLPPHHPSAYGKIAPGHNLPHHQQQQPRWTDCVSIGSMDSLDTSLSNWSVSQQQQQQQSGSGQQHDSYERVRQMEKLIADATAEKQRLLAEVQEREREAATSTQQQQQSATVTKETASTSNKMGGGTTSVQMRRSSGGPSNNEKRQVRPMTRYLPVMRHDFDLRRHIEGCGHSPSLSPHTIITNTTCKGYLTKMGGHIKKWKRRWFSFDRTRKTIHYYKNKHETKVRGVIPFQQIEDVFFDHLKTHKSPDPTLTFCIKCLNRIYFMVAPSSQAMRIWMDVIVTGAMGYTEYVKTYD